MSTVNQPTAGINSKYIITPAHITVNEASWRSKFPSLIVLILSIVQLVLTIIIYVLEIASLAILLNLPTGVGIWCALPFSVAIILTFILVRKQNCSRSFATITLIAQLILLVFTFILIGITGNYVQTGGAGPSGIYTYAYYVPYLEGDAFNTKYQLVQAQLAFGILLMFSGFIYVGIYIYVTIFALWRPYHTLDTAHLFRK